MATSFFSSSKSQAWLCLLWNIWPKTRAPYKGFGFGLFLFFRDFVITNTDFLISENRGGGGGKTTKSMTYTKEIEGQFFYPMIPVTKEKLLRRISYSEMLSAFFVSFHSFSAEIKESHLAFVLNRARLKKMWLSLMFLSASLCFTNAKWHFTDARNSEKQLAD